ncbi:MAG TPA: hypothetical protein VFR47_22480 [Anaerolineales bacterium]|nr:hypothetical protein [Anaerolineales bacterium]
MTNFLRLADSAGWQILFLDPAESAYEMIAAAQREDADMSGVSYRLKAKTGE